MVKRIRAVQIVLMSVVCALSVAVAAAQQRKAIPTIGWIWYGAAPSGSVSTLESAVVDGLRDLGYVDGKNIRLEYRYAQGKPEQFFALAGSLAAQNVDVILTIGGDLASAAKKSTKKIPIVMGVSEDPVRASLVDSLARPGGNVTGVSFLSDELAGKRIEFLKEINPKLARIAVLWNPAHYDDESKVTQAVAEKLNVQIQPLNLQRMDDLESVLDALSKEPPQGLVVIPSRLTSVGRAQIAATAIKLRIPMISGWREFAEAGATASYGPDRVIMARRLAYYIDRILKGARATDLPVELPAKFELVINLKTAKQIGLTIPPNVLARADQVLR